MIRKDLGGRRWAVAVGVFLTALALIGPDALAAEDPTRTEYVGRLEGICRPRAEATEVAMQGTRADLKAERLAVAAGKFAKATAIFDGTVEKIVAVPRPVADAAKLSQWFEFLKRQESYLRLITGRLRAGSAISAQRGTARFIHAGNLANNTVIAFGFDYCSFKFSRYG